ncbi:MAG: hypothetical protein ACLFVP_09315 [Candidatus Bathyarchaeia archaeon]
MSHILDREVAKYPFLKEASSLVDSLDIKLEDMATPGYEKVLDRGAERVVEAINTGEVSAKLADTTTELLSYPMAVMYVTVIGERFLDRRYSLGEAVRVFTLLLDESERRIQHIARSEFDWDINRKKRDIDGRPYRFALHFTDYLRNASSFHEGKWKLVNRAIEQGYVYLTRIETARLLQVEVKDLIEDRVSDHVRIALPELIQEKVDYIRQIFEENRRRLGAGGLPEEVVAEGFPPCIQYCLEGLLAGRRASHMERFTLTSFLVNVGMDLDEMVNLYTSVTDYDESLTRYQIEHIAGLRGSRTRYTPPNCSTLRTHGICRGKDRICERINHPLAYYRMKTKSIIEEKEESENSNKAEEIEMDSNGE